MFTLHGLPAICTSWAPYDEYHTKKDTPNLLDPNKLLVSMKLVRTLLVRLSNSPGLVYDLEAYSKLLVGGNRDSTMSGILGLRRGSKANPGLEYWSKQVKSEIGLHELRSKLEQFSRIYNHTRRSAQKNALLRLKVNRVVMEVCRRFNQLFVGGVVSEFGLDEATLPTLRLLDDLIALSESLRHLKSVRAATWNPLLKSYISYFERKPPFVDVSEQIRLLQNSVKMTKNLCNAESRFLSAEVDELTKYLLTMT